MKTWMIGAVAAMSMLTGCFGNVCEDISETYSDLELKAKPCAAITITFNKAKCEQGIEQCTSNDIDQMEKQIDCLNEVKACVPGQEAAFSTALQQCSNYVISNACESALQ
jgi:hypothetical protein